MKFALAGKLEASDRVLKSIRISMSIGILRQLQKLFDLLFCQMYATGQNAVINWQALALCRVTSNRGLQVV